MSAGVLILLLAGGITTRLDNALYDLHMQHWQYAPSDDVIIAAIDERTMDALGSWPLPRAVHGRVINKLTAFGVRTIGVNLTMSEGDKSHPENDRLLAEAMRRHGSVVMVIYADVSVGGGSLQERLPIPEIASAAASLGESFVPQEPDGITRDVYLWGGVGRPYWPLLSLAVYQLDHPQSHQRPVEKGSLEETDNGWMAGDHLLLRFAGPPGTFRHFSYVDILNGNVDPALFKGKTVLIGGTVQGLGERITTPGMRLRPPMAGVEYMANVLESLRRGLLISPLDFSRSFQIGAAALAFPLIIFGCPGFRRAWVVTLASTAASLLASALMLRLASLWWPPTSVIVTVVAVSIGWHLFSRRTRDRGEMSGGAR